MNNSSVNYGLKKFGFINNFSAQIAQFNYLLQGTENSMKGYEIDAMRLTQKVSFLRL